VIDLSSVHRVETSAVALLEREAREKVETRALVFSGVSPDSVLYADLQRGGLRLNFGARYIKNSSLEMMQRGPMGFEERADAINWCKSQIQRGMPVRSLDEKPNNEGMFRKFLSNEIDNLKAHKVQDISSEEDAVKAFRDLPQTRGLFLDLFLSPRHTESQEDPGPLHDIITRFKAQGGRINSYEPGQRIQVQG